MNLEKLYEISEKENIKIYDWYIEDCTGIYLNYDKINAIALNYDEIGTYIEEKCTLAEELGHYYSDATYKLNSAFQLRSKQEYKAKKWAYSILVPISHLKEKISQGLDLYDLADYFEVDCKYMIDCINFYNEKYGILI